MMQQKMLGQVTLVSRPSLGQVRLAQGFVTTLTWEQTQQWDREFTEGLAKHPECANIGSQYVTEYVKGVKEGRLPAEGLPMTQRDLDDYKTFKECISKTVAAPIPASTSSTSPSFRPSEGIPTWAYAAGGIAILGVVLYAITSR